MKKQPDIFSYIAKSTIVIPIVIVILAVIIKFTPSKEIKIKQTQVVPTMNTKKQTDNLFNSDNKQISVKESTPPIALDLKGPWVCDYDSKEATISAFIKDKKIYANYKSEGEQKIFLVNGDCAYSWAKGKLTGEKYCNIEQYMGIIEVLQSMNLFNIGQIFDYLPKLNSDENVSGIANNLNNICQKKTVSDIQFVIPKNIKFKEEQLDLK